MMQDLINNESGGVVDGSSDKAEVYHQSALAGQDLMVLFDHHHCHQ